MGTCLTTLYIRVKFNILWKLSGRKHYWINCWRMTCNLPLRFTFGDHQKLHTKKFPWLQIYNLWTFFPKLTFWKKIYYVSFLKLEHIRLAYIQTLKYTQNLQNLKDLKFCFASSDNHIWRKKFVLPTFSNTSIFPERSNLYIFDVL